MHRVAWLFSLTLLAGCVSTQEIPLAPNDAQALRGRQATLATRDRPDFGAMTPGRAAIGGLIGGVVMIEAGNRVVQDNDIQDPSSYIARTLAAELGQRYELRVAPDTVRIDSDDVAQIAKAHPQADLMLDVRTINWSYVYYPTSWNRYRVIYSARLRLIDIKRAQAIAEGFCARVPDDAASAPSGEELLANGAQRLKSELRSSADFCVQQFRSATFALGGPAPVVASVAPAAAPATPVAAPPSVVSLQSSTGGLPREGDTWTYRLTEPKRTTGPKQRTYVAKVASASGAKIVEQYSIEGGESGEWTHSAGTQLMTIGASVFSPYLSAFRDLSAMQPLGRVESVDPVCNARALCTASARVIGREVVRVPAGSFEAVKVRVEQTWRSTYAGAGVVPGGREMYVWYAPAARRAVKFSSRATAGFYPPLETDFDLELMSYSVQGEPVPAVAAPASTPAVPQTAKTDNAEIVFWESIRASQDAADFRAYLEQYPQGTFAALARNRLAALGKAAPASK